MDTSVYALFGLELSASPHEILAKCREYCNRWTMKAVRAELSMNMSSSEASVSAKTVFEEGEVYLKSAAAMLLDPSARQCYDAWLDTVHHPTSEKKKLTRSRLLWFNDTASNVCFSASMFECLNSTPVIESPPNTSVVTVNAKPRCRECRCNFDFSQPYLVLHCHCTTRAGHLSCLTGFSERVRQKCPVCRQTLLKRNQISKYLLWNVKEKYKFIA